MGNSSFLNSNLIDTPYQITARSNVNVSGIVTASSFVGNITGNVTGNADTATSATTATTATNAQGLTGTPNITIGIITAASAEFSGNVTVGGTITYEDVKNVDSLGIVTARTGIDVLAGGINVVGISTINTGIGTVHVGAGNTTLLVDGDARVTGILTIGTESITLDPTAKQIRGLEEIIIGIANTITIKQDSKGEIEFTDAAGTQKSVGIGTTVSINTSGIITATSFVGDLTGDVTGNADTATLATTATYAVNAGLASEATYAVAAGLATEATYAVNAGLATEATFAVTAGVSTFSSIAGVATFATTSGISTNVIGGIASVSALDVTGVSTLPAISGQNINVSGIITANAFIGDGTGLTGVGGGSVISGITIREEGSTVGTAGTVVSLNFVGDNITATSSGAAATITSSATPTFDSVSVGVATVSTALYLPQYTTSARDAATFAAGAIIFNTTTKKINFYDGTNFIELPGVTLGLGMGVF